MVDAVETKQKQIMTTKDKGRPEPNRQYRLTGGSGTPSIMQGNTWAESEVEQVPLTQIAYSHRHEHEFEWQLAPDEEGNTIAMCVDENCTAIKHDNGTITYNNDA